MPKEESEEIDCNIGDQILVRRGPWTGITGTLQAMCPDGGMLIAFPFVVNGMLLAVPTIWMRPEDVDVLQDPDILKGLIDERKD